MVRSHCGVAGKTLITPPSRPPRLNVSLVLRRCLVFLFVGYFIAVGLVCKTPQTRVARGVAFFPFRKSERFSPHIFPASCFVLI